jgi:hypothetical protein
VPFLTLTRRFQPVPRTPGRASPKCYYIAFVEAVPWRRAALASLLRGEGARPDHPISGAGLSTFAVGGLSYH